MYLNTVWNHILLFCMYINNHYILKLNSHNVLANPTSAIFIYIQNLSLHIFSTTVNLDQPTIISCCDYWNSFLTGLPMFPLAHLQVFLHIAVRWLFENVNLVIPLLSSEPSMDSHLTLTKIQSFCHWLQASLWPGSSQLFLLWVRLLNTAKH